MKIGIDFDNTIICYDKVFCELAKTWKLVPESFHGTKRELRDVVRKLPNGDSHWQRMQGQVYGALIGKAAIFPGVRDFVATCNQIKGVELFIVSHKTEFGHYDEKRICLRTAAKEWLDQQGFFRLEPPHIKQDNVFFAATREEKIERIKTLRCTHFIDDLIEVLDAPTFPKEVQRFLFQPTDSPLPQGSLASFNHWSQIKEAIFSRVRDRL